MDLVSDLLTLKEVVKLTRMSITKIRQLVKDGKIKAIKPGRAVMVKRKDLDAFLDSTVIQPKAG
jgi:excisionase family DNA binding protein